MLEGKSITPLSQTEYELVSEAIYRLVQQYDFPDHVTVKNNSGAKTNVKIGTIDISYLTSESRENICVIPVQDNAQYRKKYVTGGFEASVDFQIAYKCYPVSDLDKIVAQKIVSGIMKWLESKVNVPALTDNRTITEIRLLNSFATVDKQGESGNMVFVSTASLIYEAD